ncbi:MAG: epoxyqueuosine reductase QueH [Lachnospiraceae bacterium]|nr:epoxyqueuosine reductase QueH [Lachnospiraceae bacterium]
MNRNYSKELEKILKNTENRGKRLFLHSCCAPCSSYVLEYLRAFFRITVFYYNPNITEDEEYFKRVEEQKRLIFRMNSELTDVDNGENATDDTTEAYPIDIVEGNYEKTLFFDSVKGLEQCPEGGERCFICYEMRLRETAKRAKETGADYFTTTLTISPLKNAAKLNEIGEQLSVEYGIDFLPSDFKKKGGYQRSIELSKEYDLYRQDYCGCIYSKVEREKQKK